MKSPPIDYVLLGEAVAFYRSIGYKYIEVPWAVENEFVDATCPSMDRSYLVETRHDTPDHIPSPHTSSLSLVGSAEQGFLSLDLEPGRYVGCTPCFRVESVRDHLYQPWFMKVELFDNRVDTTPEELLTDAQAFYRGHGGADVATLRTEIGWDLMLADIEIGSYGARTAGNNRPWVCGTGLALPRFSVARALHGVLPRG